MIEPQKSLVLIMGAYYRCSSLLSLLKQCADGMDDYTSVQEMRHSVIIQLTFHLSGWDGS